VCCFFIFLSINQYEFNKNYCFELLLSIKVLLDEAVDMIYQSLVGMSSMLILTGCFCFIQGNFKFHLCMPSILVVLFDAQIGKIWLRT